MNNSRWKDAMSKSSSLRKSLLSLSQQSTDEDRKERSTHSVDTSKHPARYGQHDVLGKPSPPKIVGNMQQWATSLKRLDPRWQIRKFFNDISVFGRVLNDIHQSDHLFEGTAIFSVWRPTSADAIAKMMRGDGVGKGLDIKGKSAKKGELSGYVPFFANSSGEAQKTNTHNSQRRPHKDILQNPGCKGSSWGVSGINSKRTDTTCGSGKICPCQNEAWM
mmetsp:Transcript_23261/g.56126  ORF Transcript_23261/g.56126 Transcript_23261/m.56126 type:complete len:219 (-) Transcript_23261:1321-1977(-)